LPDKKLDVTAPTEESTVTTTQSSQLQEESTVNQDLREEIVERIGGTENPTNLTPTIRPTSAETEMPKEEMGLEEVTTEASREEVNFPLPSSAFLGCP